MVTVIERTELYLPKDPKIDAESFWRFLSWKGDSALVQKKIKEPYEKARIIGIDNPCEREIGTGKYKLHIKAEKKGRKPSYGKLFTEITHYLETMLESFTKGLRQKGVRKIKGKPYITARFVLEKIEEKMQTEDSNELRFKFRVDPVEIVDRLALILNKDYSSLTEYNTAQYSRAVGFLQEGNKRVRTFRQMLFEESLKTLGQEPDSISAVLYEFDGVLFIHQLEPRRSVEYKSILNELRNALLNGCESLEPVFRNTEIYVRLDALIGFMNQCKAKNEKKVIEQNVFVRKL